MPDETADTECTSGQFGGGINGATTCGCAECCEYERQLLAEAGLPAD